MIVSLRDLEGATLFSQRLHARPCARWGRERDQD
jgi:hypothetical protein